MFHQMNSNLRFVNVKFQIFLFVTYVSCLLSFIELLRSHMVFNWPPAPMDVIRGCSKDILLQFGKVSDREKQEQLIVVLEVFPSDGQRTELRILYSLYKLKRAAFGRFICAFPFFFVQHLK